MGWGIAAPQTAELSSRGTSGSAGVLQIAKTATQKGMVYWDCISDLV